jgi:8-oxo-dGTP diphosphatase
MQTTIVWQKCLLLDPTTKKILVMQRSDYKKDGGKRDLIGGSVDFGEEVSVAIKREAEEETGILLDDIRPLHVTSRLFTESSDRFFVFILWVCESWKYAQENVSLSDEHTTWKWLDIDEFLSLDLRDTVDNVVWVIENYFRNK